MVQIRHPMNDRRQSLTSFTFTDPVDFDQMEANFEHGLLGVTLKKSQKTPGEEDRQVVIGIKGLTPLEAQSCFGGWRGVLTSLETEGRGRGVI
jgi:hypothetical protein